MVWIQLVSPRSGSLGLKSMSTEEVELRTLTVEGILSVQAGDNPRVVADKLTSYVPPVARNSEEDSGGAAVPQQQAEAA